MIAEPLSLPLTEGHSQRMFQEECSVAYL